MRRTVALTLTLAVVSLAVAGCSGDDDDGDATTDTTAAREEAPDAVVFGDSLTFESWDEIVAAGAQLDFVVAGEGVPGDALCDAIPKVEALDALPDIVVVAYVGNDNTECTDGLAGAALAENYARAAEALSIATGGSRLVLVGPPDMDRDAHFVEMAPLLRERYEAVAQAYEHVSYVDSRTWLSPEGYTESLPCRPEETDTPDCVDGVILVRRDDGVHVAAPGGTTRWADAVVSQLLSPGEDLGFPPVPPIPSAVPPGAIETVPDPGDGGIAVFGDSLTLQASGYLQTIAAAQGREISIDAYGGAALCDWDEAIDVAIAAGTYTDIVLAFAGNNVTPCMAEDDGSRPNGEALASKYIEAVRAVVARADTAGIRVVLVGPPEMNAQPEQANARILRETFSLIPGVTYLDMSAVLSPSGYAPSLTCFAFETIEYGCADTVIPVRDADGVHLAPPNAADYSSGAWRYASALLG